MMAMPEHIQHRRNVDEELARLYEATKDRPRGSIIDYDLIHTLTGKRQRDLGFQKIIGKWKRQMAEKRGITPKAVFGVGYRYPTCDEQVAMGGGYKKQAEKRIDKAAECVGLIDPKDLPEDDRKRQTGLLGQLMELKERYKQHKTDARLWLTTKPTNPQLPKPQ